MQCSKYGVRCPGYKRPLQFHDEGPRLQKSYQTRRLTISSGRPQGRTKGAEGHASEPQQEHRLAKVAKGSMDERVHPALIRQSFINQQPQVFKEFVCAAFPTMFFHNEFRFGNGFTFPDWVVKHFGAKEYYDACVSCITAEYLAHLTGDARLRQFSRQKYSRALTAVRKALDSDEASSDSLLIAVILLAFYEMNSQTTREAWIYHSRAIERLMLNRPMDFYLSGVGRICHFAYRPFLIAMALYEGDACFLSDDRWQTIASRLRAQDSQKNSEWAIYITVYETIFMELVKFPGYLKQARNITSLAQRDADLLAQRVWASCQQLRILSNELRSLLAAYNQRKDGIIFHRFVGPEPSAFPETSPSLLLNAAVNATSILQQLFTWLTTNTKETSSITTITKEETSSSHPGTPSYLPTPESANSPDPGCALVTFPFSYELGGRAANDGPPPFTWLDRIAGTMGLLGAEITYIKDERPRYIVVER